MLEILARFGALTRTNRERYWKNEGLTRRRRSSGRSNRSRPGPFPAGQLHAPAALRHRPRMAILGATPVPVRWISDRPPPAVTPAIYGVREEICVEAAVVDAARIALQNLGAGRAELPRQLRRRMAPRLRPDHSFPCATGTNFVPANTTGDPQPRRIEAHAPGPWSALEPSERARCAPLCGAL